MPKTRRQTPTEKLAKYRTIRNFAKTSEPRGGKATDGGNSFVVHKHDASHLHYDFRLELDGVLLSWAVPKGPSLNPGERRLAMRTEDHPLDYGGFEGIIPEGQYGAGSVIVWDRGTWQAVEDPRAGLKKGHLVFTLKGEKLSGRWHLVRTKSAKREAWLLFKGNDEAASNVDVEVAEPNSVLSGKSVEAVGGAPERVWLPKNLHLTHPDKVLYTEQGITKTTLAIYYLAVQEQLLPLVGNRPLMLVRCPNGASKECFHQKHAKDVPSAIRRVRVQEEGEAVAEHTYVDSIDGLVALVQVGVLEIHVWGCHADDIERPDQLVFDLDPDAGLEWNKVVTGAKAMREFLEALGLQSFVKTTGGKGLHVVVPVSRHLDWSDTKAFCKDVVRALESERPDLYVTNPLKNVRKGKIFLDYLRNARGATAVAAYSPRAREGATVSTPIDWQELTNKLDPKRFTVLSVPERLKALGKKVPWQDYGRVRQSITAAARRKVSR